ncbi:MAG: hypothetical protein EXS09_03340 [Gemmataceae bacterium]|nr:hypothetical protein [Gemmataceae bacterium]
MPNDRESEALILTSSTIRITEPAQSRDSNHPDERLSLFWRVFGGTFLSICALVAISLYNNLANSITELRGELSRVNEARGEMVKKEEFNSRTQNMWDLVQSLQEMRVAVGSLKEQMNAQNEKTAEMKGLQEKLSLLDQRVKAAEDDHKALVKAEFSISMLEQKAAVREAQLKAAEDERKDTVKQLQDLRERFAKVEGAAEAKPAPKSSVQSEKDR